MENQYRYKIFFCVINLLQFKQSEFKKKGMLVFSFTPRLDAGAECQFFTFQHQTGSVYQMHVCPFTFQGLAHRLSTSLSDTLAHHHTHNFFTSSICLYQFCHSSCMHITLTVTLDLGYTLSVLRDLDTFLVNLSVSQCVKGIYIIIYLPKIAHRFDLF